MRVQTSPQEQAIAARSRDIERLSVPPWSLRRQTLRTETHRLLSAERLEPPAYIYLGVRFPAVMARAALVRSFFIPLENGELGIAAVNDDPAHRMLAFLTADFTSINSVDHSCPQNISVHNYLVNGVEFRDVVQSSVLSRTSETWQLRIPYCVIPASADRAAARASTTWCASVPEHAATTMTCKAPPSPQMATRAAGTPVSGQWRVY
jgi:hypothetical protein